MTSTRRATRQEFRGDASLLRPGLWLLDGDRVARHWRVRPPAALVQRPQATGVRGRARAIGRQLASLAWVSRRLGADAAVGHHAHAYSLRLPRTYRPESVLFDLERGRVLRVRLTPADASRVDVPTRLDPHVRVAPFEALPDGRSFCEAWVEAPTLRRAGSVARRTATMQLLRGYASLVAAEGDSDAEDLVTAALDSAATAQLPAGLQEWLDEHRGHLSNVAASWPLVPSHADLTASNVLLADGEPILIDFEWAGYFPFFYDPMLLVLREATEGRREDLLDLVLRHEFTPEIAALCDAARCGQEPGDVLLVATLLVRCHTAALRAGRLDPEAYARYVRRQWRPLEARLT